MVISMKFIITILDHMVNKTFLLPYHHLMMMFTVNQAFPRIILVGRGSVLIYEGKSETLYSGL